MYNYKRVFNKIMIGKRNESYLKIFFFAKINNFNCKTVRLIDQEEVSKLSIAIAKKAA